MVGTESCQFHHIGVILSGRLAFEMDDGVTFEAGPGDTMDVAPGHDAWVVGDQPVIGIEFIGVRGFAEAPEADLVLMTLLFTDIVDSTATAEKMGDARWHERLLAHNDLVRGALDRYQGREVKTTGDGFLASFDSPVRAVNSAKAIRTAVSNLRLSLRIGIHTGEAQRAGNDLKGISVHVAARVMAEAGRCRG
jgi:class 3 adenylate cyclase